MRNFRIGTIVCFLLFVCLGFAVTHAAPLKPAAPAIVAQDPQTPPVATQGQSFAWDYTDAQIAAAAVDRFEVAIDGGIFASIGMATKIDGQEAYKWPIPPLTTGPHTFLVRACNTSLCGDASAPLSFVLAVKPSPVPSVRIIGG